MIPADEALERLREGNRRFVSEVRSHENLTSEARRIALASGRSRSPSSLAAPIRESRRRLSSTRGWATVRDPCRREHRRSLANRRVEFAAERAGARLVVVLGRSQCGAILATLEQLKRPTGNHSRNLRSIVDRISPSVEPLLSTELRHDQDELVRQAVRANVRASANQLRHGSDIVEELIQKDGLRVVGAEYSLDTGIVEFFDAQSEPGPRPVGVHSHQYGE